MSNKSIKLLSFDLDNTLYDNQPVLELAESKSKNYLALEFKKQNIDFDFDYFLSIRNKLMVFKSNATDQQAIKLENLTHLRQQALQEFCQPLEYSENVVKEALQLFLEHRSKVLLAKEMQALLSELVKHYPIVSVSNGNCDPFQTAMKDYITKHYSPEQGYRAKPHQQMLEAIQQDFLLRSREILHIGDQLQTDGIAAKNAQCQFYYFSPFKQNHSLTESCADLLAYLNL
jgi:FMN hydrolase / 5-amino-6-(5-phospho-D-ribitylamino)uracil phosphatase